MFKVLALGKEKEHPHTHNVNSNFQLNEFSKQWR